jgi:hypothetical protein
MSLETWKAEFYPVEAKDVPADKAVEHSLTKWRGLRSENLTKHELCVGSRRHLTVITDVDQDVSGNAFRISAGTCALCIHYDNLIVRHCTLCPLAIVRMNTECDEPMTHGESEGYPPYQYFVTKHDPEPMIQWLEKADSYEKQPWRVWVYDDSLWVAAKTIEQAYSEFAEWDIDGEDLEQVKELPLDARMDFSPSICGEDYPADWPEGESSQNWTMEQIIEFQQARGVKFPGVLARSSDYC